MNEYSNNWDSLTMRDKAEMMKVAIANGITTLPEIRQAYNEFAKGGKMNNWTMQDEAGYRYWRSRLPKNLRDTNDNDYDMRAAYKAGLQPEWNPDDKSYHLGSRDPKTGRILKAPHHPTFLKALTTDADMGYYPTMDGKGNTYTETWRGNVQYPREIEVPFKAYGGNLYGNGGSKVAHDAKYNHAVTLYQGYIDRGMTPQTALELTNQKIAEKGWTGWASGDNKKFSTPDAFMDHTVDFHERMYPDSLNVNNFNQFFNGLEEGKHKYNPAPTVYKRNLLMTRPGVKKRINEYRATQGQAPLALLYPGQEGTSLGYDIVQPDYMKPLQEQPNIAANGGTLFDEGGYKPSESIKKRITDWEGSSMKTNRSFEAEANDFNKVIPAEVRSKLSPSQLDALYSYGYNVGMGNLKQRVLPTLVAYTQGKTTREDVQRSMWASKDNILRGLTLRRNAEREMFGGNYRSQFTGNGLGYHMDQTLFQLPQEYFDNINAEINNVNLPQIQMPNNMDVDPAIIYKPPVIDDTLFANPKPQAIEVPTYNPRQEGLDNLKKFNTIMGLFGQDTPFTGLVDNNKPSLLDYVGQIYS